MGSRHRTPWGITLRALLPSFIAPLIFPDHRHAYKRYSTSYLDGLRGLAAVVVCFCHYTEDYNGALLPYYGFQQDGSQSSWIQLPYLRLIFSGRPMVHIFFVISGFALSYKPMKELHAGNLESCYTSLSSSAFRRPIRLFGPCLVSTLLIATVLQMYSQPTTWAMQLLSWKDSAVHELTSPWNWGENALNRWDVHLWTIPIEFAHSMLVFVLILLLSRLRLIIRQSVVLVLLVYFMTQGRWAAFEFVGGMFWAEYHVMQTTASKAWEGSASSEARSTRKTAWKVLRTVLHICILLVAGFIAGWPNMDQSQVPVIRFLLDKTPEPFATRMDREHHPQIFWFAICAWFVVWSCGELRLVRAFLESDFSQYCGRISYAMYIMHGPVLRALQRHVLGGLYQPAHGQAGNADYVPAIPASGVRSVFGASTPMQRTATWFVGLAILFVPIVWAADIFWRAVDIPMVNIGRTVENACLDGERITSPRQQGYSLVG